MLGFNKYVVPLQRINHSLGFNIQGLDTIKYDDDTFEVKARKAIEIAINSTTPARPSTPSADQIVEAFLFYKDIFVAPAREPGEHYIASLINRYNFILCTSIDTQSYTFLGLFTNLRADAVVFRLKKIPSIMKYILDNFRLRVQIGAASGNIDVATKIFQETRLLLVVAGDLEKTTVLQYLSQADLDMSIELFTISYIQEVVAG